MQENIVGGTVTYYFNADLSNLESGLKQAENKIEDTAESTDKVRSSAERSFGAAADAALSFASSVVNAVGNAIDTVNSLGKSVVNTFEQISGITMPTPDMGYATGALSIGNEMAAKMEGASMGMTLMTKDANRTQKIMDSVINDATRTTFNVSNLLGYTQQIGAAAKGDYEGAEKAALGFGGAMVAAGNGLRDMGLVVRNVQQGMARGYNSIDLRQFKTYIPQFTQIMESVGLTDEKIIAMGVDGAKAVNEAIANWVETEQIWEKYEHTYTNLKESLNEALQTTAMEAYTESGLFDAIKSAMESMKDNLPTIKKGLMGIATTIKNIVKDIDWKALIEGVAAGIEVIAKMLSSAAKIVMDIIKWVGGGDISKGIKILLPLLTGVTVGFKAFQKGLGLVSSIGSVFSSGLGGAKKATEAFGGVVSKVAGAKGGGKLASLTQLAISLAAFAGALWLIDKALPSDGAAVAALALVKLPMLAATIVSMELFAKLASKLRITKAQVRNLTMMAGELALFAAAIWVVDKLVPSDIGTLSLKLAGIAEAIGGLALISGIIGVKSINKAVTKGLVTVTAIAGVLAVAALALRAAYEVIPDDFGGLQARIGSLALVIVEIGVLAGIIGALMSSGVIAVAVIAGLATIIAIAGTLALTGVALKAAYEAMPDDFGGFQAKIGSIALIATEISGLSIALGAAQIFSFGMLTVGLLTLMEISGALATSAINIKTAADNMPDNMEAVAGKIEAGVDFLMKIKDKYAGPGGLIGGIANFFFNNDNTQAFDTIANISYKLAAVSVNLRTTAEQIPDEGTLSSTITKVQSAVDFLMKLREQYGGPGGLIGILTNALWNQDGTQAFDTVVKIADKLKTLASHLEELANVSAGKLSRVVNGNLFPILKQCVDVLKKEFGNETGGLFATIGSFFYNNDATTKLDNATKIAETLGNLVGNLTKIQDVKVGKLQVAINQTIPKLKEVVEKLKNEFTEEGGFFKSFGSFFSNGDSTETLNKASEIANTIGGMTENLTKIGNLDLKKLSNLGSDDKGINPILKIKDVVTKLKSTFVDDADSVTNKLKDYDTSGLEKAKTVADNIKNISETLSGITNINPNVEGINGFIEKMKTIVAKIIEQFGPESGLGTLDEDTATSINNVSSVVKNISEMNENVNSLKPVNFEDVKKRIYEIKDVISEVIHIFVSDSDDRVWGLTENFSDDLISSAVNQVLTTINGMKSIGTAVQDLPTIPEDVKTKIGKIRDVIRDVVYSMDESGEDAIYLTSASVISESIGSVVTVIQKLKEVANIVKDFPDAGKGAEFLKTFTEKLSQAIKDLPNSMDVETLYADISTVGETMVDKLLEGFKNKIDTSVDQVREPIVTLRDMMKTELIGGEDSPIWHDAGSKIIADLALGIMDESAQASLEEAIMTTFNYMQFIMVGEDIPFWYQIGQKVVSDIATGIQDPETQAFLESAIMNVFNFMQTVMMGDETSYWFDMGRGIVANLAAGMMEDSGILQETTNYIYTIISTQFENGDWGGLGRNIVIWLANGMLSVQDIMDATAYQLYAMMATIFIAEGNWFNIGRLISSELANGISSQFSAVLTQVRQMYDTVVKTLDQKAKYSALGKAFSEAVASGINSSMNKVRSAMSTLNSVISNISTGGAFNTGANIAAGIAQGISYNIWRINYAVGNLSSAAINTLKRLLDIHSPSRVMFRLGEFTGEGLARGITSTESSVAKATLRTGHAITETAFFTYKNVGVSAGQGLVDGLNSMSEKVAEAAKSLADQINTQLDTINPVTYTGTPPTTTGTSEGVSKTNNLTVNNNIYNELDLSAAMSRLKWEMEKG